MLLRDAMLGCRTVLDSKKLVPDQKASRALPLRAVLMVGSATDRLVASKATARTRVHKAIKARKKSLVGLNTGLLSTISTSALLFTRATPDSWAAVSCAVDMPVSDSFPLSLAVMIWFWVRSRSGGDLSRQLAL
jgi:hypothetical protein